MLPKDRFHAGVLVGLQAALSIVGRQDPFQRNSWAAREQVIEALKAYINCLENRVEELEATPRRTEAEAE